MIVLPMSFKVTSPALGQPNGNSTIGEITLKDLCLKNTLKYELCAKIYSLLDIKYHSTGVLVTVQHEISKWQKTSNATLCYERKKYKLSSMYGNSSRPFY